MPSAGSLISSSFHTGKNVKYLLLSQTVSQKQFSHECNRCYKPIILSLNIYIGSIETQLYGIRDPSCKSQDLVSYFHVDSCQIGDITRTEM